MAAVTDQNRLNPRTATGPQSIWRGVSEPTFRQNVVRLARACNGVAWRTDPVTQTTKSIVTNPVRPNWATAYSSEYLLPLAVEQRLCSDLSFIAAAQEGVHSITAGCIEEDTGNNHIDTGLTLTLRLAANGGIPDHVRNALQDIWGDVKDSVVQAGGQSKSTRHTIFAKIVRLNCGRILQRVRAALGHPPGFLPVRPEASATTADKMTQSIKAMLRVTRLTAFGRSFVAKLAMIEQEFRDISTLWSPQAVANDDNLDLALVTRLQAVSKQALRFSTTGQSTGGILLRQVLGEAGLDAKFWLENKSLVEVDKIGAYWRIAKSLVHVYREMLGVLVVTKVNLEIATLTPYRPVHSQISSKASLKKPRVDCFVHAEIQLLCHYVLESKTAGRRLPRLMGASKLSCFLCFLCISCHGGLQPPLPHGQIFDQWTIPDLAQFNVKSRDELRRTLDLMNRTVLCLSRKKHVSRAFPLTSRVFIEEIPESSREGSLLHPLATTDMETTSRATEIDQSPAAISSAAPDLIPDETGAPSSSSGSIHSSYSDPRMTEITTTSRRLVLSGSANVEIWIEAEWPCSGQARLDYVEAHEDEPGPASSIAVEELRQGEERLLSRRGEEAEMVIDLKLAALSGVHRLKLRWAADLE